MTDDAALGATNAERMDRKYRMVRHTYDLSRPFFLRGRGAAVRAIGPETAATILEVGCGTGRNLRMLRSMAPDAKLHGVDVSKEMLASSRRRIGDDPGVVLAEGDGTDFDAQVLFGRTSFDAILFSYSLSMIPDWKAALAHSVGLLAPGGRLAVVDFGTFSGWGRLRPSALAALARFEAPPMIGLEDELRRLSASNGPFDVRHRETMRGTYQSAVIVRAASRSFDDSSDIRGR